MEAVVEIYSGCGGRTDYGRRRLAHQTDVRVFQFEHFWFVGFLAGMVIAPWTITLVAFPHVLRGPPATCPWRPGYRECCLDP